MSDVRSRQPCRFGPIALLARQRVALAEIPADPHAVMQIMLIMLVLCIQGRVR